MIKRAAETFNNKVGLIYEYNKKSPLFARMAAVELDAGNPVKAISILDEGMNLYPNYAVPYFVLGKCYASEANYSEALKAFKTGCDMIRSPLTYNFYVKEIEALQKQKSIFHYGVNRSFFSDEEEDKRQPEISTPPVVDEPVIEEPKFETPKVETPPYRKPYERPADTDEERPYRDLEERLEEIAKGISSVKLNEVTSSEESETTYSEVFPDDAMIVSETLAKIYAAQGEIGEAIQVYKKLILKNPSKEDYYNEKINELRLQLE